MNSSRLYNNKLIEVAGIDSRITVFRVRKGPLGRGARPVQGAVSLARSAERLASPSGPVDEGQKPQSEEVHEGDECENRPKRREADAAQNPADRIENHCDHHGEDDPVAEGRIRPYESNPPSSAVFLSHWAVAAAHPNRHRPAAASDHDPPHGVRPPSAPAGWTVSAIGGPSQPMTRPGPETSPARTSAAFGQ